MGRGRRHVDLLGYHTPRSRSNTNLPVEGGGAPDLVTVELRAQGFGSGSGASLVTTNGADGWSDRSGAPRQPQGGEAQDFAGDGGIWPQERPCRSAWLPLTLLTPPTAAAGKDANAAAGGRSDLCSSRFGNRRPGASMLNHNIERFFEAKLKLNHRLIKFEFEAFFDGFLAGGLGRRGRRWRQHDHGGPGRVCRAPLLAPGFKEAPSVGPDGFVVPEFEGWAAGVTSSDSFVKVSVAGAGASGAASSSCSTG